VSRVVLLAEAREDVLEAFRWYESERRGLGKVFRSALNDTLRRVRGSPLTSAVVYRDL
jgi:toxin ParE1/3/4